MKGVPIRTLKRWIHTLKKHGYIRMERHGRNGIKFWVAKAKHKTKLKRIRLGTDAASILKHSGTDVAPIQSPPVPEVSPIAAQETRQPMGFNSLTAETAVPITKGFTPKSLSLLQQDTAAQTAASPTALLRKVSSQRQMPRQSQMTEQELDERRRFLADQTKEVLRNHPELVRSGL
jgi:hypothetical protein